MNNEQKLAWLQQYLHNCLGEELPNIQDNYIFGHHQIPIDSVLKEPPQIILNGRTITTISLQSILEACESIEVLTKESFGVMCTNNPTLKDWYLWTIDRGMIEL